jgi:prephenate dehydratase
MDNLVPEGSVRETIDLITIVKEMHMKVTLMICQNAMAVIKTHEKMRRKGFGKHDYLRRKAGSNPVLRIFLARLSNCRFANLLSLRISASPWQYLFYADKRINKGADLTLKAFHESQRC